MYPKFYIWALKYLHRHSFKAKVYTVWTHGLLGLQKGRAAVVLRGGLGAEGLGVGLLETPNIP